MALPERQHHRHVVDGRFDESVLEIERLRCVINGMAKQRTGADLLTGLQSHWALELTQCEERWLPWTLRGSVTCWAPGECVWVIRWPALGCSEEEPTPGQGRNKCPRQAESTPRKEKTKGEGEVAVASVYRWMGHWSRGDGG